MIEVEKRLKEISILALALNLCDCLPESLKRKLIIVKCKALIILTMYLETIH